MVSKDTKNLQQNSQNLSVEEFFSILQNQNDVVRRAFSLLYFSSFDMFFHQEHLLLFFLQNLN